MKRQKQEDYVAKQKGEVAKVLDIEQIPEYQSLKNDVSDAKLTLGTELKLKTYVNYRTRDGMEQLGPLRMDITISWNTY